MRLVAMLVLTAGLGCGEGPAPPRAIPMIAIPGGYARGPSFPCEDAPVSEWVEPFEIDMLPVDSEHIHRWRPMPDVSDHGAYVLAHFDLARAYCASRGLELPTVHELWRAARGERDFYDWGNEWHRAMVCPRWTTAGRTCWWPSRFGVYFVLPDIAFFGELATSPHCPEDVPLDVTNRRVETDWQRMVEPPPLTGLFRCVRRARDSTQPNHSTTEKPDHEGM